ncbi:hypothetical protein [Mycobacterium sp. NPDC004974]
MEPDQRHRADARPAALIARKIGDVERHRFNVMSVTNRNIGRGFVESIYGRSVNPGVRSCVTERLHSKRKPGVVGGPVRDIYDGDGNLSTRRDCRARALQIGQNASSCRVVGSFRGASTPM